MQLSMSQDAIEQWSITISQDHHQLLPAVTWLLTGHAARSWQPWPSQLALQARGQAWQRHAG